MVKSYQHLNLQERAVIETQLAFGMRPAASLNRFSSCSGTVRAAHAALSRREQRPQTPWALPDSFWADRALFN